MSVNGAIELQETDLKQPDGSSVKVKPGDKIVWIEPEILKIMLGKTNIDKVVRHFIKQDGDGHFILEKITLSLSGNITLWYRNKDGVLTEASRDYFKKWE